MESKTNTFILSDESVNSYGYRVLTAGMSLSRFKRNPVMLYSHDDMVLPIGRWENVRVDGGRILADAVFDEGDDFAVEVKRKVDAGLLRCCSIGFMIRSEETDFRDDGSIHWTITDVELFEVSVCTFPAYEETGVSARHKAADELKKRASEAWKLQMKERLSKKSTKED